MIVGRSSEMGVSKGVLLSFSCCNASRSTTGVDSSMMLYPALLLLSWAGSGIGRTRKNPIIIGNEVPKANTSRKEEVFPRNMVWDMVEKKKADRPKPDRTIPVVVALCITCYKSSGKQSGWHHNLPHYRGNFSRLR